jgi:hypothetical protein
MESLPDEGSSVPRVHPLEIPFVWFGLQFVELAIVWLLIETFVPKDVRDVPLGVGVAFSLALLIGLSVINYRIRRRFIPR